MSNLFFNDNIDISTLSTVEFNEMFEHVHKVHCNMRYEKERRGKLLQKQMDEQDEIDNAEIYKAQKELINNKLQELILQRKNMILNNKTITDKINKDINHLEFTLKYVMPKAYKYYVDFLIQT